MLRTYFCCATFILALLCSGTALAKASCEGCHAKITPSIVSDWKLSKHSANGVSCDTCHGSEHSSEKDVHEVGLATPETCSQCHADRVEEFKKGKHAKAWDAAIALPTTHWQPSALLEGMKGCTGCHKIGLKSPKQMQDIRQKGGDFGVASCDACHTRHVFSSKEASSPQACRTCHMGIDHPQWEMFESSKHGVRYLLKQSGVLPENVAAPTCQTCHMPDGTHTNRTAWGFMAIRMPMPFDTRWAADRTVIFKGLGLLDPDGEPTPRMELFKNYDVMRMTQEDWLGERNRMIKACSPCHSENFARKELQKGDDMVRESDRLLAAAIKEVASLYRQDVIEKPEHYTYAYPDLLTFHDTPTRVETKLFEMFLKHRMRTFQGAFHSNPDYTFWYGWSEMKRDLQEIRELAQEMHQKKRWRSPVQ